MQPESQSLSSDEMAFVVSQLRAELLLRIKPILRVVDAIEDSQVRLILQASCLDLVTGLEDQISKLRS